MFLFRRNLGSRGISLKPSITGAGVPHLHDFHKRGSHHSSSQQRLVQEVLVLTLKSEDPQVDIFLAKNNIKEIFCNFLVQTQQYSKKIKIFFAHET